MSTAWYKPNSLPRRIRSWTSSMEIPKKVNTNGQCRSVEVWDTTCVVTNMNSRGKNNNSNKDGGSDAATGMPPFTVLINPGNPSLSGVSRFSYFPVGGPEPPKHFQIGKDSHPIMGYVSSWGGMEVGTGMAFASNTVDGLVHQYGGKELLSECERVLNGGGLVEEGAAVATRAVGPKLREASGYDFLVHTVPPFFEQDYRGGGDDGEACDEHNDTLLAECYRNSLRTASAVSPPAPLLNIACPLLGAGCRGFPVERSVRIAAKTASHWMVTAALEGEVALAADPAVGKTRTAETSTNATAAAAPYPFSSLTRWLGGGNDRPRQHHVENEKVIEQGLHQSVTLAFGIPDGEIRERLMEEIEREMEQFIP